MAKPTSEGAKPVEVQNKTGETWAESLARDLSLPFLRHGVVGSDVGNKMLAKSSDPPAYGDYAVAIKAAAQKTSDGNLSMASEMLTAQAMSLDIIFTEMVRRSAMNMGDYPAASDRYMRLALKAQTNSRATLDTLAKLHQPREQTVRHVHVNEGGQAVVAEQFHHHAGGSENAKSAEQPHAPESGAVVAGSALPCPDPIGDTVPVPGGERKTAVPDARRQGKRRAKGQ